MSGCDYRAAGRSFQAVGDTPAMAEGDHDLVELTRRSMQATNEGEFEAAVSAFAEDASFDVSAAGVGRFEGRAAIRSYLEDWVGSYKRQELAAGTASSSGAALCSSTRCSRRFAPGAPQA
jgi:SnoaL-like domain